MVDAVSEDAVANLLSEKKLSVTEIRQKDAAAFKNFNLVLFNSVKTKDLVIFFRQLSVMVDSDLPIVKALRILVKQSGNRYLKAVVANLADEVEGGAKMSEVMGNFPDVFSNFYVNMIASGETSGRLSEVLNYLADQKEKDYDLQSKVRAAMIYPGFILFSLVVVGFIIVVFVMPKMTAVLEESGAELPLITRFFITVTGFISHFWWQILVIVVGLTVSGVYYFKTAGRSLFDWLKLKIPTFGVIFQQIHLVTITRSLATLLKGGVPVSRALSVVKDVVGNRVYEEILDQTIKDVDEGNQIADSFLIAAEFIPLPVSQLMSVGEETGRLSEVLEKLTAFYTREVEKSVNNLAVIIEPIIMIILGVAVGIFIAAVLLPMWQMSSAI